MIEVRDADVADLDGILEIYNEAVINTTATYDYAPRTRQAQRDWFDAKRSHAFPVLVAAAGDAIVGFATYGAFRQWPGYVHTVENSIYVAAQQRGRRIGTTLFGPLIEAARMQGHHVMVAGIDAENEASLRLHARFGFEKVAHFREVGWKFDRWLDVVFVQRLL